ncbi:histidine phosphatase family protein [uncultured Tateyamaria sp.]|uniref:histidine phosphatase family protein n=1 Tax=uncultured Tateyamaria sp. TaxID=455651 RepID=UPI00263A0AF5|nr:histidine phosphatase family protein [uncultured Tateyamaria sp.]
MRYPDLLILRHGETEWNLAGRMQGEMDSPLTAKGRAQADAQGRLLTEFGVDDWALWSSPQGRARATAQIALGARADEARHDARLTEITMGAWTGKERREIAATVPHMFETEADMSWYDHAPGGEGIMSLYTRTGAFLADLTGPAVIVTHGITSRMLRCHALGLEPGAFDTLPGGQGVVYHLSQGVQTCLSEGA